jgi:hypothetical protein
MGPAGQPERCWMLLHYFWRGARLVCGCARCPGKPGGWQGAPGATQPGGLAHLKRTEASAGPDGPLGASV